MTSGSDRRTLERYEVIGVLEGPLDLAESVRVVDISPFGMLILSQQSFPIGSTQAIKVSVDGQSASVNGSVRYVRRVIDDNGFVRHLIGFELISLPTSLADQIKRLSDT